MVSIFFIRVNKKIFPGKLSPIFVCYDCLIRKRFNFMLLSNTIETSRTNNLTSETIVSLHLFAAQLPCYNPALAFGEFGLADTKAAMSLEVFVAILFLSSASKQYIYPQISKAAQRKYYRQRKQINTVTFVHY